MNVEDDTPSPEPIGAHTDEPTNTPEAESTPIDDDAIDFCPLNLSYNNKLIVEGESVVGKDLIGGLDLYGELPAPGGTVVIELSQDSEKVYETAEEANNEGIYGANIVLKEGPGGTELDVTGTAIVWPVGDYTGADSTMMWLAAAGMVALGGCAAVAARRRAAK